MRRSAAHRQTVASAYLDPHRLAPRLRKLFALLLLISLAIVFFRMIAPFLESLILAAILSALLYPLYARLSKYTPNDGIASFAVTVAALVVLALPLAVLVGALTREAVRITEAIGPWVEQQTGAESLFLNLPDWLPFAEQLQPYRAQIIEGAGRAVSQAGSFVVDSLSRATQGTIAFLLYLFVMLYAIFFFLLKGPALLEVLSRNTPLGEGDKHNIAERGLSVTRATLKSILVIGVLQGALGGIAFAVVGIEGPVFWGLIMALASAIPGIGAALIWAPAAVILLVGGNMAAGIGLAAWGAIVVSSVDNVLRPYLVGNETRLPDLLILVSTLGGLAMFGAPGILIGPVIAGLFMTSLSIFVAAFRDELTAAADHE